MKGPYIHIPPLPPSAATVIKQVFNLPPPPLADWALGNIFIYRCVTHSDRLPWLCWAWPCPGCGRWRRSWVARLSPCNSNNSSRKSNTLKVQCHEIRIARPRRGRVALDIYSMLQNCSPFYVYWLASQVLTPKVISISYLKHPKININYSVSEFTWLNKISSGYQVILSL